MRVLSIPDTSYIFFLFKTATVLAPIPVGSLASGPARTGKEARVTWPREDTGQLECLRHLTWAFEGAGLHMAGRGGGGRKTILDPPCPRGLL